VGARFGGARFGRVRLGEVEMSSGLIDRGWDLPNLRNQSKASQSEGDCRVPVIFGLLSG